MDAPREVAAIHADLAVTHYGYPEDKQRHAIHPPRRDSGAGHARRIRVPRARHRSQDEKRIAPHIPVWDKSERDDGTFGRSDFAFDAEHNRYVCPAGKYLKPAWRSRVNRNPFRYRASQNDCQACPLKPRCCPNMVIRKIDRSPFEPARDVARALAKTETYRQSRKARKKVQMLFAHLKRILKLDRLRLRGPSGARDEFLLAAIAQNLRRMAKRLMFATPEVAPIAA